MAWDTLDDTPYFSSLMTISGGGLTVTGIDSSLTGANQGLAMPFSGKSTGKWYIECTAVTAGTDDSFGVVSSPAICKAGGNSYGFIGGAGGAGSYGQFGIGYKQDGDINHDRLYLIGQHPIVTWSSWTTAAVLGLAMDLDNGVFWWRVNGGVWLGLTDTGDPASNTGGIPLSTYPIIGNGLYWPAVGFANGSEYTFNFGASSFTGSVPSGFTAGWTLGSLPAIGSYLSNGTGGAIAPTELCVSPYVARANSVIIGLQGNCSNTTEGIGLVYDSDGAGGGPGTLLASGAGTATPGVSNYTLSAPLTVTSGHTYYLGIFITPNGPYCYVTKSGGTTDDLWIDTTASYPTPNATFVQSSNTTDHLPMISLPLAASGAGTTQGHIF